MRTSTVNAFGAKVRARSLPALRRAAVMCLLLAGAAALATAQNSSDRGTPAESKTGQAGASTYARDKVETVNLANGNFTLSIPLATIGGRGAASFAVALSYNSKVWTAQHDREGSSAPGLQNQVVNHYTAMYDKELDLEPYIIRLGGGWTILSAPGVKGKRIGIDPVPSSYSNPACNNFLDCGYNYVLTKMWLSLPDGSQVELRDAATGGAPAQTPTNSDGYHPLTDRDRGRVWRSFDGSGVTFVRDAGYPAVGGINNSFYPSGWVFLSNGTRLRMEGGVCSRIVDADGNYITIGPGEGASTVYTDELGRQTTLQVANGAATVTAKGYMGAPDRSLSVNTGLVGDNLRADFQSLPRPFTTGDALHDLQGNYYEHTIPGAHTDLFNDSEGIIAYGAQEGADVGEFTAVTRLNLLDGRSFRFRYNQYGEVAEVVYPGGGVSQVDYQGGPTSVCELRASIALTFNRRVSERRTLTDGSNADASRVYTRVGTSVGGTTYPSVKVEAHQGSNTGALLSSDNHVFYALDADYRPCGGPYTGTGNEKWTNAREFRTEVQTGTGTVVTARSWEQRAPVAWANDVGSNVNAYAQLHGIDSMAVSDPRVTWEETTLEDGKTKRVEYAYDQFNNVTLTKEYDFGTPGTPGPLLRQTVNTYVGSVVPPSNTPSYNGYCYTNLDPLDSSCGGGLASDVTTIIYQKNLLLSQEVKDGAGNREAYAEYEYDNYASGDGNHLALAINQGMMMYDGARFAAFDSSHQPRGNVTMTRGWLEGTGQAAAYSVAYSRYDNAGNVASVKDARGYESSVSYADDYGDGMSPGGTQQGPGGATFALPTAATNALGQAVKTQYSYTLGATTGAKDPNGVVTRTEYDPVGRPVRTTAALGLAEQAVAEMSYPTASANVATASRQLDSTRWLASRTELDGFDRSVLSATAEDGLKAESASFTIFTRTVYDALGRARLVTNPYRAQAAPTDGWTRTTYDLGGRVTEVATFAGGVSSPPATAGCVAADGCTGVVVTTYDSEQTTVKDQAGRQRRSTTDGLGRLASVDEMYEYPSTSVYAATTYDYDARGNLTTVHQGQQTRAFVYDGLSRLILARNPEQDATLSDPRAAGLWSLGYAYDTGGNLLVRTDARGVSAHYDYDALSRVTRQWYNGSGSPTASAHNSPALPAGVGASDEARYFYDSQTLPAGAPASFDRGYATGRLVATIYGGGSSGTYLAYDAAGRTALSVQQTGGVNYQAGPVTYNLAGAVTSQRYPSGHTVSYNYDAAGRPGDLVTAGGTLPAFSGNLGDGVPRPYSSQVLYHATGVMSQERFGTQTPLYHKLHYNSRGQLYDIRLSTASWATDQWGWNRGAIINYYGGNYVLEGDPTTPASADNNGNLRRQQHWVPANGQNTSTTFTQQTYDYDALNRLSSVVEAPGANGTAEPDSLQQTYDYDRWGNRTVNADGTWLGPLPPAPSPTPGPSELVNERQFDKADLQNTNRLYASGDPARPMSQRLMRYDAAGNLTHDVYTGAGVRTYDAENRMTAAADKNGGTTFYSYDADGRRVRRMAGSAGEVWQVYGVGGELLAEYAKDAPANQPQKEYGYRGGELLVTAAANTGGGWGPPPSFTGPDPLAKDDAIKLENLTELRGAVNQLRQHAGLPPYTFTVDPEPASGVTAVKADHIRQLRAALEAARSQLGLSTGGYEHPTLAEHVSLVYAKDFQELRDQIRGAWQSGAGGVDLRWLVTDQLGTPRMVVDQTGSFSGVARHDYLPFGEELLAGAGGRMLGQGYGATDNVRQKFTGKELDTETGLDYFEARYFSPTAGRFSSADPLLSSAVIEQPQSWNRYSYTLNNPLRYSDPVGLYVFDKNVTKAQRDNFNAGLEQAKQNLAKIAQVYGPNSTEYKKAQRAVAAYGDENVDNGVKIFAKNGSGAGRAQVAGVTGAKTKENPTGQQIRVSFDLDTFNADYFSDAIAHEGSHVADGSDWVKSGFADSSNPTPYRTEFEAYMVQSYFAEVRAPDYSSYMTLPTHSAGKGKNPYLFEFLDIWNPGWAEADKATMRKINIDKYLARPKSGGGTYGFTPNDRTKAFTKGANTF